MTKLNTEELILTLFAVLSFGLISVLTFPNAKIREAAYSAEGPVGIGSRAGPMADQLSAAGGTVSARTDGMAPKDTSAQ